MMSVPNLRILANGFVQTRPAARLVLAIAGMQGNARVRSKRKSHHLDQTYNLIGFYVKICT